MESSDIFSRQILSTLGARQRPVAPKWDWAAAPVRDRHLVFDPASDLYRAHREAWCAAIHVARSCGLLDDDLCERLTGLDDDAFRGAIAECVTAHFFVESGFAVNPRPLGRGRRQLDMAVSGNGLDAAVEVKAPYVPSVSNVVVGNDAHVLRDCIARLGASSRREPRTSS